MATLRLRLHEYHQWHHESRVTEAASAVAFWLILSFGPAGVVAINVLGLGFEQHDVAQQLAIVAQAAPGTFGDMLIAPFLAVAQPTPGSWWRDVLLVAASLWTVSTAVAMLLRGLRRGFGLPTASFAIVRIAAGAIGLGAILFLGAVALSVDARSTFARTVASLVAASVCFALVLALYRIAVGRSRSFHQLWPGALFASLGLIAIELLWERFSQVSPSLTLTYGTVAGLITSFMSVWIAAFVVLLGPFITSLVTDRQSS